MRARAKPLRRVEGPISASFDPCRDASLALHNANHIGGRRELVLATGDCDPRSASKTRPLLSLRDIGSFRPTEGSWTFELSSLGGSPNAWRERLDEVSRVRPPESASPTAYGIDRYTWASDLSTKHRKLPSFLHPATIFLQICLLARMRQGCSFYSQRGYRAEK